MSQAVVVTIGIAAEIGAGIADEAADGADARSLGDLAGAAVATGGATRWSLWWSRHAAEALALLTPAERDRMAALRDPGDAAAYALAHAARSALRAVRPGAAHASLSRRRGAVAVALHTAPVGIDVEQCPAPVEASAIARRFFAPDEASVADPEAFSRLWTRKEALAKASGLRLADALAVPVDQDEVEVALPAGGRGRFELRDLPAPDGHRVASAVAVAGR